jgi:hypothetical protein
MNYSRRDVLKMLSKISFVGYSAQWLPTLGLTSCGNKTLPGQNLRAEEDHFFLAITTIGGFDATLGLDPQILPAGADAQDMFLEYRPDQIHQKGAQRLGIAAMPLEKHLQDCLILNGIMMRRDAGHIVALNYMLTGRGDGKIATVTAEIAEKTPMGPFGIISNANPYLANKIINKSSTNDLLKLSEEEKLIELIEEKIKVENKKSDTPYEMAEQKIVEGKAIAKKLSQSLKEALKKQGSLNEKNIAVASFSSGAATQAELMILNNSVIGLDSHSNHEKVHLASQKDVWSYVSDLFDLFKNTPHKKGSLFDYTTFMIATEWSRTPYLNAAKGKDHNPFTNSILLAGKNILGGKTIGKSHLITRNKTEDGKALHIAVPFNYQTGQSEHSKVNTSFIYPENIIRTLFNAFKIAENKQPLESNIPIIPGVISPYK